MADKMTDAEFAAKAEYEGVSYALLDYDRKSKHLADKDSELYAAVVKVEKLALKWRKAMDNLEAIIHDILADEDEDE